MQKYFLAILLLASVQISLAQSNFNYYYNKDLSFDQSIPTPKDVLGYEVGDWHVSHDKLVEYMKAVASASDRVSLEVTGYTYEQRQLLLLTITSSDNHSKLPTIKKEHLELKTSNVSVADMPVVVWLGHSIHGNEASGSNASMLMLYYLAAAQGQEIDKMLDNTVILFDPSYNPDGLNRFASWVNSHKSKNPDPNRYSLEHNEAWPGGRTNHYWFDLNRDWLPLQHPESQARVKMFYEWQPNILTDQHEMGANSTYFFQPGIPSRNNPHTPEKVFDLTRKIAKYHADAMDKIGSQYYSEESFDDYYPGKGSTFPDLTGSVGILFEQASSRGHLAESVNGNLSFKFAIRNHVTTSLSTLEAAQDLKVELLEYQRSFFKNAASLATNDGVKAYVFSGDKDISKTNEFIKILQQHQIEVSKLENSVNKIGPDNGYLVKLNQPQYRLIKAIFEKRTTFKDSLFYDVSAWTLPLAFGMDYEVVNAKQLVKIKSNKIVEKATTPAIKVEKGEYGYLLVWDDYMASAALSYIQNTGLRTKLATNSFQLNGTKYAPGTCFIPIQNQVMAKDLIFETISKAATQFQSVIIGINSGNASGVRLGSPSFEGLKTPKIAVIAGDGVSSSEVGEIWHLLDQRLDMPMSLVGIDQLNSGSLNKYNTIIMVNGSYGKLKVDRLKEWVTNGGLIVATKRAGKWLSTNKITSVNYVKTEKDSTAQRPYKLMDRYAGAQYIGGAIFETKADLTNPLFYGYNSNSIPIFRNSTLMMERSKNAYANPLMYTSSPLLSGYVSKENELKLANSAAVQVDKLGNGRVITFTDNPNFRAFWYGTNRMFLNAIFFGKHISVR